MGHFNPLGCKRIPALLLRPLLATFCAMTMVSMSGLGVTVVHAANYCAVPSEQLRMSADKISTRSSKDIYLRGHAQIQYKEKRIRADRIHYDNRRQRIDAKGNIQYSGCPTKDPLWFLNAEHIIGDLKEKEFHVRDAWLVFANTPVIKVPRLQLSLDEKRQTGFLTPRFQFSSKSGTSLGLPFYWNLAPNYDLLYTPDYLSKRGLLNNVHFRALSEQSKGEIKAEFIDDRDYNDQRYFMLAEQETTLGDYFKFGGTLRRISDEDYEEDLNPLATGTTGSYIHDEINLDYALHGWQLHASTTGYLRRNDIDARTEQYPFLHRPRVSLEKQFLSSKGFQLNFNSHYAQFFRKSSRNDPDASLKTSERFGGAVEFAWTWTRPGFFLTPSAKLDWTGYALSYRGDPSDKEDHIRRTVPSYRLHTGMQFSRHLGSGRVIHVLEPELKYVRTSERDQSDIPLFDTRLSEFNLAQVLAGNAYNGLDRISDTHQIGIVLNNRLLHAKSGQQIARWGIGKIHKIGEPKVCIRDNTCKADGTADNKTSDYIAEMELDFNQKLRFTSSILWDKNNNHVSQSFAQLGLYGDRRDLSLSYRQRRRDNTFVDNFSYGEPTEQAGFSFGTDIGYNWSGVANIKYDLRRKKPLEHRFGLQYNACCWGVQLSFRRHLADIDPDDSGSLSLDDGDFDYDSFVGVEFQLKTTSREDRRKFRQSYRAND